MNWQGRNSLVLGATGGIGRAMMDHLGDKGCRVVGLSRADSLDWQHPEQAEQALIDVAAQGPFDLVFDATGALQIDGIGPEKSLSAINADAMSAQFAVNAIGPAILLKQYRRLLPRTGRSMIATLSARVGSIGDNRLGGWIAYRASKAALNQIIRTASIEIARTNAEAVVVALHPGTVYTGLSDKFVKEDKTRQPMTAAHELISVLEGLEPGDSGKFYAYDGSEIPW